MEVDCGYGILICKTNSGKMGRFHDYDQKILHAGQNPRRSIPGWRLANPRGRNPSYTDSFGVYIGAGVAGTGQKTAKSQEKAEFSRFVRFSVIDLTYSSSRMASVRLTRLQVETIFKKGKVRESFEPMKVSDVIEVLNHIHCVDYILDHVMEPLTQKFIRKKSDRSHVVL